MVSCGVVAGMVYKAQQCQLDIGPGILMRKRFLNLQRATVKLKRGPPVCLVCTGFHVVRVPLSDDPIPILSSRTALVFNLQIYCARISLCRAPNLSSGVSTLLIDRIRPTTTSMRPRLPTACPCLLPCETLRLPHKPPLTPAYANIPIYQHHDCGWTYTPAGSGGNKTGWRAR